MENPTNKQENKRRFPRFNLNYIGLGILAICYIGALWNVFQIQKDELIYNKKVIRICHWQLELGFREALDEMIKRFEKENPDVKVIQIPIPERAYGQWVTTQLIGRTAPDIIEIGMFDAKEYLGRYFIPVSRILRQPNPYNKDNPEMKDVPWMDTFSDGLQNAYIPELLDYYGIGFSQFTVRIFYNKTLFRKILGHDKPLKTLTDFFSACEKMKQYVDKRNQYVEGYNRKHPKQPKEPLILFPIASSSYQANIFKGRYLGMLTADRFLDLDIDCDGKTDPDETFVALLEGRLKLDDPKYKVAQGLVRKIAQYFPPGFMSLGRMDAGFSFVQGRSTMITSGSWDASSFIKQINDQAFGDIILNIDGKNVTNSSEVERILMRAAKDGQRSVKLKVNREGSVKTVILKPQKGKNLWKCYGMELADFASENNKKVPVVTEVDSASPASRAGLESRKRFEVGIFDFPLPDKQHPEYGKYVAGPVAESSRTGCSFGIIKFSRNKELAIKFLQFCTTPENNELFNKIAQWIPAVKGAKPTEFLKVFSPNYKGYWGALRFGEWNSRTSTREQQVFWSFISGEKTFDEYIKLLKKSFPDTIARDIDVIQTNADEQVPDKQIRRSIFLAKHLFNPEGQELEDVNKRLTTCWDIVLEKETYDAKIKARMAPFFDNPPKNKFTDLFFESYKQVRSAGGAK